MWLVRADELVSGTAFGVDKMQKGEEVVIIDMDRGKVILLSI